MWKKCGYSVNCKQMLQYRSGIVSRETASILPMRLQYHQNVDERRISLE